MKNYFKTLMRLLPLLLMAFSPCNGDIAHTPKNDVQKNSQDAARQKILSLCSGEWVSRGLYVATKLEIADYLDLAQNQLESGKTYSI